MSGTQIPILPKQIFEYGFLATGAVKTIVLHRALDVIPFKSGRLLLRVHDFSHAGDGSFKLALSTTAPSDDDTTEFTSGSVSMVCTADSGSTGLEVATDSDLGPYLKVELIATQDSVSSQTLYAELSADLVVRET
jgi:hypothetical protein